MSPAHPVLMGTALALQAFELWLISVVVMFKGA